MARLLSHIHALTAIGLAQIDSYERVGIGKMCTGGLIGWGDNNRDMPVRRVTKNHWEVRVNDATSNSYAMVSGIIGALLDPKPLNIEGATSTFCNNIVEVLLTTTQSSPCSTQKRRDKRWD
jgi:glutamine synthetase